jgi:hypothetical protein
VVDRACGTRQLTELDEIFGAFQQRLAEFGGVTVELRDDEHTHDDHLRSSGCPATRAPLCVAVGCRRGSGVPGAAERDSATQACQTELSQQAPGGPDW